MARRRRAKNSNDTLKYFLIGAAALVVLFLVFNVGPTGKFTGTTDLDANLVAELSFDSEESGTTPDTGPNSYSATVSGATLVSDGFLGSAYLFNDPLGDHDGDGTSNKEDLDYVPQNHFIELPGLDGTDFPESGTLSMWIYLDSSESPPTTWSKLFDTSANGKNHFWVRQRPDSTSAPGGIQVAAQGEFCSKYISGYVFAADNTLNLITDNWINIVLTWDEDTEEFKHYYQGNNKKTYEYRYQNNVIDGITTDCVNSDGVPVTSWVPDEQIVKFYGDPWNSKLDEIRIYDIALTEAQVAALYGAYTANQPPTITAIDDISRPEDSVFTVQVEATDLNNEDTLTYDLLIRPTVTLTEAAIDSNGLITGTLPSFIDGGNNEVTMDVWVGDGTDTTSESFIITIETPNRPPVFTGVTPYIAQTEGSSLSARMEATDPENNPTVYALDSNSDLTNELSIDSSSGVITGTLPSFIDGGNNQYTIVVEASDGDGNAATESFSITVLSDADSDGVQDDEDLCSNTAVGTTVNEAGCSESQLDSDSDGVSDDADLCSNTAATDSIDEYGCSESQLDANADSDEDGVINSDDLCPATPIDATVNSVGCPDTDGDGTHDDTDTVWSLTEDVPGATTDEEVQVISHSLENDGTFSMNLQAATNDDEELTSLTDSLVLVKVTYYDLQTNEEISSTIYTSQISIGETSVEAFSISVPASETAVRYIATVNIWSGMIGAADWQPYSEKIELRGEFHP